MLVRCLSPLSRRFECFDRFPWHPNFNLQITSRWFWDAMRGTVGSIFGAHRNGVLKYLIWKQCGLLSYFDEVAATSFFKAAKLCVVLQTLISTFGITVFLRRRSAPMKRQLIMLWYEPGNHLMALNRQLESIIVEFVGILDSSREFIENRSRILTCAYNTGRASLMG